ncbi:MAG: FtsX-like permease family protein [Asgard group archaeon]|nr:FtsX-like permease family protein [Asgard group archaeon]
MLFAIRHAVRGIRRRKLKNLINTLGILIGVSLLAGVQIATDSLVNAMEQTVSLRYGNADINIQKGEYQTAFFNYSIYEILKNDPILNDSIDGIAPRINANVALTSFTTTKNIEPLVTIIGLNQTLDKPFGEIILDPDIENNDFNFSELSWNQCFAAKGIAEEFLLWPKDEEGNIQYIMPPTGQVEISFLDAKGYFRTGFTLNIKGVVKGEGKGILRSGNTIFMKLHYLQSIFNTTNKINNIVVSSTRGNANARNVTALIEERLEYYLGEENAKTFQVVPQKANAYKDIADSINNFRIVLYVFGSLIIISGVLLILNITLMNIDERERSIGIMKAIGMTQQQLITTLLTESVILGGIGALLGLAGGVLNGLGIIFLLENFFDIGNVLTSIPLIVNPVGLIISFVIGVLLSLFAAIYPAWKASRLDIVDTINEIETPERHQRSSNWAVYLGSVFLLGAFVLFGLFFILKTDWIWMVLACGIFLFLMGVGFVLSRFINQRLAFNGFSLSWMTTGLLIVLLLIPYLNKINIDDQIGLYTFLAGMLGLVFGTIIFVALNLEWLSNRFNDVFQIFKKTRSIGIISMRYVGKKKTRSALTFAIFGVILTMDVFLAVFTGSFTLGFDDFAENQQGGIDIIAYQPIPGFSFFEGDPIDIISNVNDNIEQVIGMKYLFAYTSGAYANIPFNFQNGSQTSVEEIPIPTDMWGINDEFIEKTDYEITEKWEEIEEDPWEAAKDGSKKYIILPEILKEFEFEEQDILYRLNATVGDRISILESNQTVEEPVFGNYTIIAFVDTTSYATQFANFIFTGEDSVLFNNVNNDSAFLISINDKLSTEEIREIASNIETELFGFDTLTLRYRIEEFMDFAVQAINFMQAFVSLGLVFGVLGLIIVSLRGVTERTREIGMMRALGFQRGEVITAVVVEIFAVAFVGLIIGFINGFILGYGMYEEYLVDYDFRFIIPWALLGIFIGITIVLSVISAVIPARRAAKIPPSKALRYTG